jgi:hypothetical protein
VLECVLRLQKLNSFSLFLLFKDLKKIACVSVVVATRCTKGVPEVVDCAVGIPEIRNPMVRHEAHNLDRLGP